MSGTAVESGRPAAVAAAAGAEGTAGYEVEARSTSQSIMAALGWIPRLVILHLAWMLLVLMGGVVIGLAPATVTMIAVSRRDPDLARSDGAGFAAGAVITRYRAELWPANRAAGPFVGIGLVAALNVALGIAGALPQWYVPTGFIASVIIGALATAATFHAISLYVLRPGSRAPVLWRAALAGPFIFPVATASWAVTLCATAMMSAIIQPIGWLLSGGILIIATTLILVRTWQGWIGGDIGRGGW